MSTECRRPLVRVLGDAAYCNWCGASRGEPCRNEIPSPSQEPRAATASPGVDRCEGMATPAAGDASDSQHGRQR